MSDNRSFEFTEDSGKKVKLLIKDPSFEDLDEAERIHASRVAKLIGERKNKRLLTRKELDDFLEENKIWTDEDQNKINLLNKEIAEIIKEIKKGGKKEREGRELCIKITDKRSEVVKISMKRQMFDSSTIESIADRERTDYIIYACTVYEDTGQNYWASFEDMKNDRGSNVYNLAAREVTKFIYNYDPEFEKNLPENKWLIKHGFINEELQFIDKKTKEIVDKNGRTIEQVQQEIQEQVDILQGEIEEESPFLDDETGEPVVLNTKAEEQKLDSKDQKETFVPQAESTPV